MENEIKLTVIVPSHRPQMICGLLDALGKQDLEKKYFETVIVCDYPIENLQSRHSNVKWLFLNDKSISSKRNFGVSNSLGAIVAFTDDDCVPHENWLSEGLTYLEEHSSCSAVEGRTTIEPNTCGIGMYRESKRLERPAMRTNNIFYRKKTFQDTGGFDQRFTVQREDADLAFSVIQMGRQIDYCAKIRVVHRFRHWEYWDLLKNCWNRRFDPLLYKKHRFLYRKHIGSPLTYSMKMQLFIYIIYFAGPLLTLKKRWIFIIHMLFVGVLGLRRAGVSHLIHPRFIAELFSVIAAPFVVLGALAYGFIRFRKVK